MKFVVYLTVMFQDSETGHWIFDYDFEKKCSAPALPRVGDDFVLRLVNHDLHITTPVARVALVDTAKNAKALLAEVYLEEVFADPAVFRRQQFRIDMDALGYRECD